MGLKHEDVKNDWNAAVLPGIAHAPSGVVACQGARRAVAPTCSPAESGGADRVRAIDPSGRPAAVPRSLRGRARSHSHEKNNVSPHPGCIASLMLGWSPAALARPTIEELKARVVLDDYESNVLFGYNIVMETNKYAGALCGQSASTAPVAI